MTNTSRELTVHEIASVCGGASSGPLGGLLGPKVDGVTAAAGSAADDVVIGATTGVNGIINSLKAF